MLLPFSIAGESHIGQSGIAGSKLPLLQPPSMPVDRRGRDQAGKMDDRHGDNNTPKVNQLGNCARHRPCSATSTMRSAAPRIADAAFTIPAPRRRPPSTYQLPPQCYERQIEGQSDGFEGYLPYHTPTDATLRRQDERTIDCREA